MPGQDLFAYEDESGEARDVTSQDVNEYLRCMRNHGRLGIGMTSCVDAYSLTS